MVYNNINIKSDKKFTYAVGYDDLRSSPVMIVDNVSKYIPITTNPAIYILNGTDHVIREDGMWRRGRIEPGESKKYNPAVVRVLFPDFSLDVYNKNMYYGVEIFTYLQDTKVVLASKVISRIDALAVDKVMEMYGQKYYEYYDINIIDPYELLFGSEWAEFRQGKIAENEVSLMVSITPLNKLNINEFENREGFVGSQSSFRLNTELYPITLSLSTNYNDADGKELEYRCRFKYCINNNIIDYIKTSFGIDPVINIEVVVSDGKDVFKLFNIENITTDEVTIPVKSLTFDNWIGYREGMFVMCSANIKAGENSIMYIISNKIPLTPELFSYMVKGDIKYINLNDIDMKVYNINTINKNIIKTVNLTTPDNSKSNIIQPVFFKVRDLGNIVIHPDITENICINLDQYKSKVKGFALMVEGVSFPEIGRTTSGIVFKVAGNKLPKQQQCGNYYITNEDSDVITGGKYNYDV